MHFTYFHKDKKVIEQAVARVNEMRAWLNDVCPDVVKIIQEGKRIKNGTEIDKKTRGRLEPIFKTRPEYTRAFVSVSSCSMWLETKTSYEWNGRCWYVEHNIYIGSDTVYTPYPMYTVKDVLADIEKASKIRDEISELEKKLSEVESGIYPFKI